MTGWVGRLVHRPACVPGLDDVVSAVSIEAGAINYVLTIGIETVPLAVEPVIELTNEEVLVGNAEEAAVYALAVLETGVDGVQQFQLPALLAKDVFMGPSVPVGYRLSPGGVGDEFRQSNP